MRVACFISLPVDGAKCDSVLLWLHDGELVNVSRKIAVAYGMGLSVDLLDLLRELLEVRNDKIALESLLDKKDVRPDDPAELIILDEIGIAETGEARHALA